MNNSMSCSGGRWCTRADALLGVEGIHIRSVTTTANGLVLHAETGETLSGCPACGVIAIGHGRREVRLHDIPCFGRPCGCCGPSASGAARIRTVRGTPSPRNTRWRDRGRNSPPGQWHGRPTRCSVSTPRSQPWPTSSASPGTPSGTRSRQRPENIHYSRATSPSAFKTRNLFHHQPRRAWLPASWTHIRDEKGTCMPRCRTSCRAGPGRPTPTRSATNSPKAPPS
jgi:hypothetical protein